MDSFKRITEEKLPDEKFLKLCEIETTDDKGEKLDGYISDEH